MKKLNRFELAAIKRTAKNVAARVKQADKLRKIKEENDALLASLEREINLWENPIIEMTGGWTSTEVLKVINDNLEIPDMNCAPNEPELPFVEDELVAVPDEQPQPENPDYF